MNPSRLTGKEAEYGMNKERRHWNQASEQKPFFTYIALTLFLLLLSALFF